MTDSVLIKKTYREDHWVVSAEVLGSSSVLPSNVFIHENTGTAELGKYQGVCSFEELQRLKVWTGAITPIFGNRFVRTNKAESHLSQGADPDITVNLMLASLRSLRDELSASGDTSNIHVL